MSSSTSNSSVVEVRFPDQESPIMADVGRSRSRRFPFIRVGIFMAGLLLLGGVFNAFIGAGINSHIELKYREIFNPQVKATTLIFGSSRAAHGINPASFPNSGKSVYNFSYNSANPSFYLDWYRYVMRPYYRHPKTVIFNVDWFMFDDEWLSRQLEMESEWMPLSLFKKLLMDNRFSKSMLVKHRLPIYKNKELVVRLLLGMQYGTVIMDEYFHGYVPSDDTFRGESPRDFADIRLWRIQDFRALMREMRQDGINVVFVSLPMYHSGRFMKNQAEAEIVLDAVADEFSVPFLDYNEALYSEINEDKAYFSDSVHLNKAGVQKFGPRLVRDLLDLGIEI